MTHPHTPLARIRPATNADRAAMRTVVERDLGWLPYPEIPAYYLRLALEGPARESRAVLAECGTDVVGLALFGEVAGAVGAGRVYFIAVSPAARLQAIGASLCNSAVEDLRAHGARLVIAEVPAHPVLTGGLTLLGRCGFTEVGRVADYYQDGVDLVLLQRAIVVTPP